MQNYAEYAEYGPGADLREGGGERGAHALPIFFDHLFFAITLKN